VFFGKFSGGLHIHLRFFGYVKKPKVKAYLWRSTSLCPKWFDYLEKKRTGISMQSFFWVFLSGGYHIAFQELESCASKCSSQACPDINQEFLGDWGGVTRFNYPTEHIKT
jgi:hypothetical protein